MDDFTPEDAEHLIEAVAAGDTPASHADLGEALGALHAPLPPATSGAPSVSATPNSGTGRFARRTAAIAAVSVFSLVGAAAAGTAGVTLLFDDETPIEDELVGDPAPTSTTSTTTSTSSTSTTLAVDPDRDADESAGDEAAGEDGVDPDRERGDAIEGVDPSDGLDDEELELLCEAAVNHGEYVSSVARDKQDGAEHGERVREAAATDCGKDDTSDLDDDADESDDPARSEDDEADDEDEAKGKGENNGRGHGAGGQHDVEADDADEDGDGPGNGRGKARGHEGRDD